MRVRGFLRAAALGAAAAITLAGCGLFNSDRWQGNDPDAQRRAEDPYHTDPKYNTDQAAKVRANGNETPSIMSLFYNPNSSADTGGGGPGIGVNSYLWHATLDTVSFMPLASADPFGGVIITDWYSPPATPSERFKVNVFILNRELRADGVKATVFRQKRDDKGNWVDAAVDKNTNTDLENAILSRARQMRLSTASK
jgi:uncharacterized protein DUF3576